MHRHLFAVCTAVLLVLAPASASAQYFRIGPDGVRVDDGRGGGRGRGGGGYCGELRRACENKDALGERGQGNCRRFREECGGRMREERRPSREEVCRDLRRACLYKDEMGERGQGNCRRYRETCR